MTDHAFDKAYGCLVGGAVGDALGATVEGWPYDRIRREYGKVEAFRSYDIPYSPGDPGSVTDDTTMRHYLSLAIAERGGRVTPEEYAAVLQDRLNPDRVWVADEITYEKLLAGGNPWACGEGNIPCAVATMAIAPVGVVNAGDPRQAYQDAFTIASVSQSGPDRDAAATVAAGVAAAFAPDATVETVLETMMERSTDVVFRAIDLTMDLATSANGVDEFVERFYDGMLDWRWPAVEWNRERYYRGEIFSGSSLEIVPVAMALLRLCDGDPNRAIVEGASFGRDCDTIATLCGNLAGALRGADAIRSDWRERVESANEDLFREVENDPDANFASMARRLVEALESERARAESRAETLERVLA